MPRTFRLYLLLVSSAALVVTSYLAVQYPIADWGPVLVLALVNAVLENFAFALPLSGSVSLGFAANFAALLYAGPLGAVVCAAAGSSNLQEIRDGKALSLRMFNLSQLALSAGVAGLSYVWLGGQPFAQEPGIITAPIQAVVAALIFFVLNVSLVGFGGALLSGRPAAEVIQGQGFVSYAVSLVVLALLGLIIAYLLALSSWIGLALLVLPFMAARRTFRVYVELSEAYTATVRSLVTAIEAKDPYTKGHSERVARYARSLSEAVRMDHASIDLLERAALLHDVGKIGVDVDTLNSPMRLSSEEVRAIRRHPVVGSELLAGVEFLAGAVPIVRHHHERMDGAGYPEGLGGEAIPELARILAIADAYDAMTSDRAYRPAMTMMEALSELERVAGTQLDSQLVREFVTVMRERSGAMP